MIKSNKRFYFSNLFLFLAVGLFSAICCCRVVFQHNFSSFRSPSNFASNHVTYPTALVVSLTSVFVLLVKDSTPFVLRFTVCFKAAPTSLPSL
ncbi:hypothetical protein BDR26DRAFT_128761 [Obelidium mucronatum]|nr:hypothetical protein BDR26DRAFT_128761 [Obelidium mucronatum]